MICRKRSSRPGPSSRRWNVDKPSDRKAARHSFSNCCHASNGATSPPIVRARSAPLASCSPLSSKYAHSIAITSDGCQNKPDDSSAKAVGFVVVWMFTTLCLPSLNSAVPALALQSASICTPALVFQFFKSGPSRTPPGSARRFSFRSPSRELAIELAILLRRHPEAIRLTAEITNPLLLAVVK